VEPKELKVGQGFRKLLVDFRCAYPTKLTGFFGYMPLCIKRIYYSNNETKDTNNDSVFGTL